LIPFIETMIWSVKYMGIDNLIEFQNYILFLFGNEFSESIEKSQRVDPDLKACFENIIPTPIEMNNYFNDLSIRNNLPLEKINEVGHEFYKTGGPPPPPNGGTFNNNGNNGFGVGWGLNPYNNGGNQTNVIGGAGGNNNFNAGGNNMAFGNYGPPPPVNANEKKDEKKCDDLPQLDDFEKRLRDLKG